MQLILYNRCTENFMYIIEKKIHTHNTLEDWLAKASRERERDTNTHNLSPRRAGGYWVLICAVFCKLGTRGNLCHDTRLTQPRCVVMWHHTVALDMCHMTHECDRHVPCDSCLTHMCVIWYVWCNRVRHMRHGCALCMRWTYETHLAQPCVTRHTSDTSVCHDFEPTHGSSWYELT